MAYTIVTGGGTENTSNLWIEPDSAHAYDDEFDGVDMSSWSAQNISDAAVGSISVGTVDYYDKTFTTGDAVRVNLGDRSSWASFQVPSKNKGFSVYKAISLPTNLLVVTRFKLFRSRTSANDDGVFGLCLGTLSGGVPVIASRVVMIGGAPYSGTNRPFTQLFNTGGSSVYTNVDGVIDDAVVYPYEYVALHKIGATYHYYVGSSVGTWAWFGSQTSVGFTPDYVALQFHNNSTADPGVTVVGVDFIRFFETATFIL